MFTDSEELLDEVFLQRSSLFHYPVDFPFQRRFRHLRCCHEYYDNGKFLAKLSCALSLKTENILAISDHYNDLSMLDGQVVAMVACPSNAHHEVKSLVQKASGYISNYRAGEGTADEIQFYHQKKIKKPI